MGNSSENRSVNDLDNIKEILLSDQRKEIHQLNEKLTLLKFQMEDGTLIKSQLEQAIVQNRESIISTLSTIMGSMIRRYVADSIKGFVEQIDTVVDRAISLEGLKWRYEAWASGTSLAEVAFKNSIKYRVEHILLINRLSSELICQLNSPQANSFEGNSLSGLLTAINDFIDDIFQADSNIISEKSFQYEDLNILISAGRQFYLAAIVRGEYPSSLKYDLASALEQLDSVFSIKSDSPVELFKSLAHPLMIEEKKEVKKHKNRFPIIGAVIFMSLLGVIAWLFYDQWSESRRIQYIQKEINRYVDNIKMERQIESFRKMANDEKLAEILRNSQNMKMYSVASGIDRNAVDQLTKNAVEISERLSPKERLYIVLRYTENYQEEANKLSGAIEWKLFKLGSAVFDNVKTRKVAWKQNAPIRANIMVMGD